MFDLATSPTSHTLIQKFASSSKIISAVCHGPAALAYVPLSSASATPYLISSHTVTGFSNAEEDTVQLTSAMPFSLEDVLNKNSGGGYVKAEQDWGEKVVVSKGKEGEGGYVVITGQNPGSASKFGEVILKEIEARSGK